MSTWLLLDAFFFNNTEIIPCFFLLGFVTEKKVSWLSILTVSIFFDWILYSTKFIFFLICCMLKILSIFLSRKKRNDYLKFLIIFLFFFLLFNISQHNNLQSIWNINILNTYFISNFFLFCFIKHKYHS